MNQLILLLIAIWMALVTASPLPFSPQSEGRSYPVAQQFLVLHPELFAPQLSPLKFEKPIIAPITQLGHISTAKEQLYFFYPSSPLTHIAHGHPPLVSFQRDDGQDFNLISFITNWFATKPAEAAAEPAPAAAAPPQQADSQQPISSPEQPAQAEQPAAAAEPLPSNELSVGEELRPVNLPEKIALDSKPPTLELFHPDAELIPQTPVQQPQPRPPTLPQPAYAPFPLVPQLPDRRVYIVSGQPQFFGNFDAFANPLNPIFSLQPLSAIIPRSKEDAQTEALPEAEGEPAAVADEVAEPPVANLKNSPMVVVGTTMEGGEQQKPVASVIQEVDAPVDVIARSNSRAEPIPDNQQQEQQAAAVEDPQPQEEKKVEVQEKSAFEAGGECRRIETKESGRREEY